MAAGVDSRIDTKLFMMTADTIGVVIKELEAGFQDWAKVLAGLRGNWQGDTSDDIKNTAEAIAHSASDMLRSLGGYRAALNELAGIYDKTEKNVQETSKSLKFDKALR